MESIAHFFKEELEWLLLGLHCIQVNGCVMSTSVTEAAVDEDGHPSCLLSHCCRPFQHPVTAVLLALIRRSFNMSQILVHCVVTLSNMVPYVLDVTLEDLVEFGCFQLTDFTNF